MPNEQTDPQTCLEALYIVQRFLDDECSCCGDTFWRDKTGNGFGTDMGYFFEGLDMFESYLHERIENENRV